MSGELMQHHGRANLPALTGVRSFAALMVLSLHAAQNFPNWLSNGALVHHGYLGVDLFFILSGFIIAHVYLHDLVPMRAKSLQVFLWHRFIRLFPAHATVLFGLVALIATVQSAGIALNEVKSWNYHDLPWHFLMVHAWGVVDVAGWNAPSWSISAEWFAYLLFPAVAAGTLALPRRAVLPLAFATLLIGALLFHYGEWHIKSAWFGPPVLIRVASEFIFGVLLYRVTRIDIAGLSSRLSDGLAFGGLFGFCVGASLAFNDFVLIALLAVLIAGASGPGASVRTVFCYRPVLWLGELSYSIYVVHFPVLLMLRHGIEHVGHLRLAESEVMRLMIFLVSPAVVIGAAALLYYLVEYPARHRLRNLFGRIVTQPSQVVAVPGSDRGRNIAK